MTTIRLHGTVLCSLALLFSTGRAMAAEPDSPGLDPAGLQRLLFDSATTVQTGASVQVEGDPVLTDLGFLHVTAADFTAYTTRDPVDLYNFEGYYWFADGFVSAATSEQTSAVAPVHLPEGVTVERILLIGLENASGYSVRLWLQRFPAFAEGNDLMSAIDSQTSVNFGTPPLGVWRDLTIDHPVIKNGLYQYQLRVVGMDTDKKLRSAFIVYSH